MVVGIGIDLVEVARIGAELDRDGAAFRERLFTPEEIAYSDRMRYPARHYAARFAAKEALFKALGIGCPHLGAWREVEVRREPSGAARIHLSGAAAGAAAERGARRILLSLSHTERWATASVVVES